MQTCKYTDFGLCVKTELLKRGWEQKHLSSSASSEPPEVVDTDGGFGCFAPYEECPAPAEETCPDERLVKDKTSSCPYFSGVTSHLIGSRRIENVNCKQQDQ